MSGRVGPARAGRLPHRLARPRRGHRARRLGWLPAVGLAIPLGMFAVPGIAAPAARAATLTSPGVAAAPADQAQVSVDTLTPATITPGASVEVSGHIRNVGTTTLRGMTVELRSQYWPLATRSDVGAWVAGHDPVLSPVRATHKVEVALAPGASVVYRLTFPASALNLPNLSTAFGARGAAVEVIADGTGGPHRVGEQRTFLIWSPTVHPSPVTLTLLAPITSALPQATSSPPSADLLAAMAPTGRLTRVVQAGADPAFSWALDPALLSAADAGSRPTVTPPPSTPTATSTGGSGAAAAAPSATLPATGTDAGATPVEQRATDAGSWLHAVTGELPGRSAVALPYGDPDLSALARGGAGGLYALARSQSTAVTRSLLGSALPNDLAWPAGGLADQSTLDVLAARGAKNVVLADTAQPPTQQLNYTPAGRSTVPVSGSGTPLGGMLYDSTLSSELAATGGPSPTLATQQLLADLATISAERPSQPRSVLAVTPRDWNPSPAGVQATTRALHSAAWLQLGSLAAMVAQKAADLHRSHPAYPASARAAELPVAEVQAVSTAYAQLKQFAPALTQPQSVVPELELSCTSLLGQAWRGNSAEESIARQDLARRVASLYAGVNVLTGSDILFLARAARLPVTLENQLDQPVRLILTLQPRSAKLLVRSGIVVTVEAHRRQQVYVPVRVLANGDVEVTAVLSAPGGQRLKSSDPILVRLHSDWENRGLAIAGGLLGILVVAGLVRGVRRGRTRIPPESVPDADEEVVARESRHRAPPPLPTPAPPPLPTPAEPPRPAAAQHPDDAGAGRRRGVP